MLYAFNEIWVVVLVPTRVDDLSHQMFESSDK